MRLFTGISLAPDIIKRLSAALEQLRPAAHLNWSPVANLHITCRFIGEWPEANLPDLTNALNTTATGGPIPIHISRFGFFPNPHHPHSFFAGVQAGPGLADLATAINHALGPLGLKPEDRPWLPHVTLARIKKNSDVRTLRERIAAMTDFDFGAFDATSFQLFASKPTATGSVYSRLATYDLMRENRTTS
jgi:2'-5' RNA ligase